MDEKKRGGGRDEPNTMAATRKVAAMTDLVAELLVRDDQERTTPIDPITYRRPGESTGEHDDRAALEASRLISVDDRPRIEPSPTPPILDRTPSPSGAVQGTAATSGRSMLVVAMVVGILLGVGGVLVALALMR